MSASAGPARGPRVALVTGAGRRVGQALALALGEHGYSVAVHYGASADGARQTLARIQQLGGVGHVVHADLADPEAPAELVERVLARFGRLDVLVNSAAVMVRTPLGAVEVDVWDRLMAINVRAPFFLAQAAASALRVARGCIVNIADLAAIETWPAYVPHGISKAAVIQMTRALARVLAPEVRVNAIAPGAVLLPDDWDAASAVRLAATTPLQRLGDPSDVVGALRYLLDAPFVTGVTLIVDGGRHVRGASGM